MITPQHSVSLAEYTHYKIGGVARDVYFPSDCAEFLEAVTFLKQSGTPWFIIGGGSNILVGDGFWDGAVILTTGLNRVDAGEKHLICGSGVLSSDVADIALGHGKTGLEFLYRLPGTIGGAVAGNARFADISVSEKVVSLTAVHPELGIKTFSGADLDFSYKHNSIIAGGWYICEVVLDWQDGVTGDIRAAMDGFERFREERHHFEYPSCGCIFKNDHARNIQVGRLLDSLGLKGKRIGGAEVAPFHANFIINTGNATARDVLALIEEIERIVKDATGIVLEREVKVYGTFL